MNELIIHASQTPGVVTFENYEEVKSSLQTYINDMFANVDYESEGFEVASADYEELKKIGLRCLFDNGGSNSDDSTGQSGDNSFSRRGEPVRLAWYQPR